MKIFSFSMLSLGLFASCGVHGHAPTASGNLPAEIISSPSLTTPPPTTKQQKTGGKYHQTSNTPTTTEVPAVPPESLPHLPFPASPHSQWQKEGIRIAPALFGNDVTALHAPSAIRLPDGRVRIYLTTQERGVQSAIATTTGSFIPEQVTGLDAFRSAKAHRDSAGAWRLYGATDKGIQLATSADGLVWEITQRVLIPKTIHGSSDLSGALAIPLGRGFRMYYSLNPPEPDKHDIPLRVFSAFSSDGQSWTPESNFRARSLPRAATTPFVLRESGRKLRMYFARASASCLQLWTAVSTDRDRWEEEEPLGVCGLAPSVMQLAKNRWRLYYEAPTPGGNTVNSLLLVQ